MANGEIRQISGRVIIVQVPGLHRFRGLLQMIDVDQDVIGGEPRSDRSKCCEGGSWSRR
jgi:hypothetical protein